MGIEATREIKKINPKANVMMCSVMGQKKMIIEAFIAGAGDFLVKPYKKESVLEKVSNIENKKRTFMSFFNNNFPILLRKHRPDLLNAAR
jgi:DNA-binding NarL/FixJ family response regulator